MKDVTGYIDQLLSLAKEAGIDPAEVYYTEGQEFSVSSKKQIIDDYSVSDVCGLGLRGTYQGKMGYSSTQALDDAAITQLIEGVIDSATLVEAEEQDEIFEGSKEYPSITVLPSDLDQVEAADKINAVLRMDAAATADHRIVQTEGAYLTTYASSIRLRNSFGVDLSHSRCGMVADIVPIAKEGNDISVASKRFVSKQFSQFSPENLAREAAEEAIRALHGRSVSAGEYQVTFRWEAMQSLLSVFSDVFSAENAQKKLSKLLNKEGEMIAASCVTLIDDPLLEGGTATRPFDGEGVPAYTKAVVKQGVLQTLLHNRKTAKKQGTVTTGNASRGGYAGVIGVAPSNLYLQPGDDPLEQLISQMKEGLFIYELSGLHAGANSISGDFSLLCKGFRVEDGKCTTPVEQITVAGNFYQLLKNIQMVGSDLTFNGRSIGTPSVWAGMLSISGAG